MTAIERAETALRLDGEPLWHELWTELEGDLLGRLLALGPDDDGARWRLSQAIDVARKVKTIVTMKGATRGQLGKELDLLEGRKMPPVA